MVDVFANSWSLIKASAAVLNKDKELLIFPILSAGGMILLSIVFFVPMLFLGVFANVDVSGLRAIDYVILFIFYVLQYFIIFSSNTALVGAALIRLRGGDPTLADGIKIAWQHLVPIFGYSLIAATVGLLLSAIRDRGKGLGRILVSILGMVWNVATFLVVPILAVEEVGPVEAIKRSMGYLKKTWGEQLVGSFSFNAVFTLLGVALFIVCVVGIILASNLGMPAWVMILIGVGGLFLILLMSLVSSTLNGIYTAAVYQYATTGKTSEFFDDTVIQGAFHSKP